VEKEGAQRAERMYKKLKKAPGVFIYQIHMETLSNLADLHGK
jgi:hypothetical protein